MGTDPLANKEPIKEPIVGAVFLTNSVALLAALILVIRLNAAMQISVKRSSPRRPQCPKHYNKRALQGPFGLAYSLNCFGLRGKARGNRAVFALYFLAAAAYARAVKSEAAQKLQSNLGRAIVDHTLIADGDRILVGMSGGKDSYALMTLLKELQPRAPVSFDLVAVHVDQGHPGYDGSPLVSWLDASGVRYEILHEDTYSVVTEKIPEGKTYCSLCSRLRRGILYTAAKKLGCNKIALGHHRDDTLETLMMNLFFAGKLAAMPAKLTTDDGELQVIRPLIYCAEDTLRTFAKEQGYPILPCNLCGSQSQAQRKQMKTLLTQLESEHPHLRQTMLAALSNVTTTHLLDQTLERKTLPITQTRLPIVA